MPDVKRQRTDEEDGNGTPPPLDDLLVALDVASRDEEMETENVILALIARARLDGVPAREYLCLALLIAFKRRNHAASQAAGMGAGERKLLRVVLRAISIHDPEAIKLVLPFVPLYGSWRDLLVLAEQLLPADSGGIEIEDIPTVDAICTLFAEQMAKDAADEEKLPSSAAKYAPHEGRHSGTTKAAEAAKNKLLADRIATLLELARPDADKHSLRAAYRRLRSALNKRLTEAGHLLEPLLAAQRLDAIQFAKAPKGALAKCRKAIMKDPRAAERWKRAMARSTNAVPDLDDLVRAAAEALEEADEPDESLHLMPRRIAKAIVSLKEQRAALDLPFVALDGHLIDVTDEPPVVDISDGPFPGAASGAAASSESAAASAPAPMLPDFESFLERAMALRWERSGAAPPETARLLAGGKAMLGSVGRSVGRPDTLGAGDIVVICSSFASSADPEALNRTVNLLKAEGMRLLLVHRVRETLGASSGGVPFLPRTGLRPLPPRGSETIDVCFVLDLTGSMGSWLAQCRSHVASIIRSLRDELAVATVRVAFCGYRDWGERDRPVNGRVVTADFVEMAQADEITRVISREDASGGGDGPEDVLIAIEAINRFSWRGDVRVCVFIADAPAHGFSGRDGGGDDFPGGMCPDQHTPLPEMLSRLAVDHGVDLLCTKLCGYTDTMFKMFGEVYARTNTSGAGFGVLPIESGVGQFKAAILGSLTTALCSLIAPSVDTPGVQTFDGQTVSALSATLTASLRESIDAAASMLRAPTAAAVAVAEAERDEVLKAAAERVDALEAEVEAASAALEDEGMMGDMDEDEDGMSAAEAVKMLRAELATAKSTLAATKALPPTARAARSDAARLRAALEADELHPIRLALGMALPTESLAIEAATSLLRAGVCVRDLEAKGYPDVFIKAMTEAAAALARRV
ncbi:mhck ef2 kinase domain family protein [Chrysochromulina tobinii]|uniref:Mhck ef2 kinase domain family protein n=1 Tax=Chrysochromulina tobinii TaxID=1460289 RepID=A0A0M0JPI4_9EUKA|nr:mhck ef2 kinase domain family protein [Chrysochromulina tobinii]|eukprot:KOO28486.1 mhck ef2 kinase domain family protein [Chrysochromulina sp. CCMP291]